MILGDLVRIYKEYGDLPLFYRDFDGNLVEAGCHLISSAIKGFHYLVIPCNETETVHPLWPNPGEQVTRKKTDPCTLKEIVTYHDYKDLVPEDNDIPVFVKYFSDCDVNPTSARLEVACGKLVLFNDKKVWDDWMADKKRREKEWQDTMRNLDVGQFPVRIPIIRNVNPSILADSLVAVKPIEGPIKFTPPEQDIVAILDNEFYNTKGTYTEKLNESALAYGRVSNNPLNEADYWKHMAYKMAAKADSLFKQMKREHEHFLAYKFELDEKEKEFKFTHKHPTEIFQQWEDHKEKKKKKK